MFCNKCGKQIPEGTGFCQYCGARIEQTQAGQMPVYQVQRTYATPAKSGGSIKGFSVFEIIAAVLMVIIAVMWVAQVFTNLEYTKAALDFLGGGAVGVVGMILYWLPVVVILVLEAIGCLELLKKRYVISIGVLLFLVGLVMKVGSWIFDDFSLETKSIIAYRVFMPYSSVSGWTILLGAIITVIFYAKATAK